MRLSTEPQSLDGNQCARAASRKGAGESRTNTPSTGILVYAALAFAQSYDCGSVNGLGLRVRQQERSRQERCVYEMVLFTPTKVLRLK